MCRIAAVDVYRQEAVQVTTIERRSTMNHNYIDYMIKERREEEIADCERRRLLKAAGYSPAGPVQWAVSVFKSLIELIRVRAYKRRSLQYRESKIMLMMCDYPPYVDMRMRLVLIYKSD